jgi:predicted transcriptional regulator
MMGRSSSTIKTWAKQDQGFDELRREIEQSYIIEAWGSITKAADLMREKLNNTEFTDKISIRALSEVMVNLHNTVSNVAQHMMAIQVNINTTVDKTEEIEAGAFLYVADKAGMSIQEVKQRLGITS